MTGRASPIAAALLLAACQSPDVGQRCAFGMASVDPATVSADYFENGNTECDGLICIVSPASQPPAPPSPYDQCVGTDPVRCGYCSKPCVSNRDCFQSETGLECRQMILDQAFIQSLPPDVRDRYLGEIAQYSSYCAVPLPPTP